MDTDYPDYCDETCQKCGHHTVTLCCNPCGGEGCTEPGELYEEDPLWYDPGDIRTCDECRGHGHHQWCQSCGWDVLWGCYLGMPLVPVKPLQNCPNL